MKTVSVPLLISSCLLFTACNNGSGGNNNDSTLGNKMGDSVGSKMENAAAGVKGDVQNLANSNDDSTFIVKAIAGNNEELILINAGIKQGTNSQLKSDARAMLGDHTKLKTQLQAYADKKRYPAPQSDEGKSNDDLDKLNKNTRGAEWDKAWADQMKDEHKDDISTFEKGEKNVKDSALHSIITSTLPMLRMHKEQAESLEKSLK